MHCPPYYYFYLPAHAEGKEQCMVLLIITCLAHAVDQADVPVDRVHAPLAHGTALFLRGVEPGLPGVAHERCHLPGRLWDADHAVPAVRGAQLLEDLRVRRVHSEKWNASTR